MSGPPWSETYHLANLASVPGCINAIAGWQHQQWLLTQPPASQTLNAQALNERVAQLRQHLGASLIPTTFVMLRRREPVGSVSLVTYKSSDASLASVWLTNMYVLSEHRGQGLAEALLQRAEDYARSVQIPTLSLYAQDAVEFYRKRRWHPVKHLDIQGARVEVLARYLA